jgi:protein-S-isoprenylcysteine O-methyltransferase Ste14
MTPDTVRDPALRPSPFPWPPVLFAATLLAAWLLGRAMPLSWPGLDDTPARVIGVGFGVVGLAFILWAAWTLYRARTTIMPHKRVDHLVTSGPFRLRRNPIYLGEVFLMLGAAELTKNLWFVLLVPLFMAAVTWLAILPEERHLEARFGDDWRAYKAKTRRWI